jgi:nitrogenase subunit NifH
MNSINLFPTEDKQTLKAEKLRFQFSFSSYSSYMTISDSSKELTIYLDDKKVRDSIIFNVNNMSADYSRDKSFLKLLFQKVVEKINKMDKEDRAELEKWLVANFKPQEVNN